MEFQVEEHLEATLLQGLDHGRATAGEQLLADLDPALLRIEALGQGQRGFTGGKIQGDDDRGLAGHGALSASRIAAHCSASPRRPER
ncbi:hypothetical protein D3C75_975500 [compost metagenome]